MRLLKSSSNNIHYNLSTEKYFIENYKEPIFMIYISSPCVVIGKNQNALEEINYDFIKENEILVARRLSGGGAVFHDPGNLNFSFITKKDVGNIEEQFKKFTKPIIDYLSSLGVNATFSGRNDILIDGKKCSGNAQAYQKDIMLHHGTLLFDSNMGPLTQSLKPNKFKFESKGIDSVRSRVTNIKPYIKEDITLEQFSNGLLQFIENNFPNNYYQDLTELESKIIQKIYTDIMSTWEHNFGNSPKYQFKNMNKFAGGIVECQFNVSKGIIESIDIYGDFFGFNDISILKERLIGTKHEEQAIREKLTDLNNFISNVSVDEFISLLFS